MNIQSRFLSGLRAAGIHILSSGAVAAVMAVLMFWFWFPDPYRELTGGDTLFWLIIKVDIVCGPLLTLVLYNPAKPRAELWRDLGLVILIQLAALGYGLHTMWEVRPLYLVHEVDRFKVISRPDVDIDKLATLPESLQPHFWRGPMVIGLRPFKNIEEKNTVTLESVQGGRDYGERPEFYVPLSDQVASKTLERAVSLDDFEKNNPSQKNAVAQLLSQTNLQRSNAHVLPITAHVDEPWVAMLTSKGYVAGYLRGDGFGKPKVQISK